MKYINTKTSKAVPANEVRELTPGSGVYVHVATVRFPRIVSAAPVQGRALAAPPGAEGGDGGTQPVAHAPVAIDFRSLGKLYLDDKAASVTMQQRQVVDAYVVAIADDVAYDPSVHTPFGARIGG